MRRRRTIYFDDARHYYLWNFEPPMRLKDAWTPVDQVAGTAVDTFIYGVARDDGLFYPSKAGLPFGDNTDVFPANYEWRAHNAIKSLAVGGHNLLQVLIDRSHHFGLDFIASLRLGGYGGMDAALSTRQGGPGWADRGVRDHLFGIVRELVTDYNTQGIELDFAAPPGGSAVHLRKEDVPEYTPVVTDWVRRVAEMTRKRAGGAGQVGVRVYPTEEINRNYGIDVREWLKEGLVDYVSPLVYAHNRIDADIPIDWLIELAHEHDASVYPILMAHYTSEGRHYHTRVFATPAMYHAAAASFFERGCDGIYAWFLRWPLGDSERRTLADIGDPDVLRESTKHYVVNRKTDYSEKVGLQRPLPLEISAVAPAVRHQVRFYIADDPAASKGRIQEMTIRMRMHGIVSADGLSVYLNGESLESETCHRRRASNTYPYDQWMEFRLHKVLPRKGRNVLGITHHSRPERLGGGITVEDVEILVRYSTYHDDFDIPKVH